VQRGSAWVWGSVHHFYNLSPVLRSPRENCLLLPKIEICNHNAGDTKCRIWFPLIATMYYSPHGIASRILHGAASICPFRSEWSTRKNIYHSKNVIIPFIYLYLINVCNSIKIYIIRWFILTYIFRILI